MIICDIDGTICIGHYLLKAYCSKCEDFTKPECWRRQNRENCDWARMDWDFFVDDDLIANDQEIPRSKKVLQALHAAGHSIVYVTGREKRLERPTVAWLEKHGFPPSQLVLRSEALLRRVAGEPRSNAPKAQQPALERGERQGRHLVCMRATGDARPIAEVKRDIVNRLLAEVSTGKVLGPLRPDEAIIAFENNPVTRAAYEGEGVRFFQAPECWKEVEHYRELFTKAHGSNQNAR